MAILGQELIIGAAASPTTDIAKFKGINGDSFLLDNAVFDGNGVQASNPYVGQFYQSGVPDTERFFTLVEIPVDPSRIAGHEVEIGEFWLPFKSTFWTSFTGPVTFGIHLLLKTADLATATWTNRASGTPWGQLGGKPGVDFESVPIAIVTIDNTLKGQIDAVEEGLGETLLYKVTLTAAYRYAAERAKSAVQLMIRPTWAFTPGVSRAIVLQDSRTNPTELHAKSRIVSLPPIAPFGVTDGEIDYTRYLDPTVDDRVARVQTGSPAPGGTGPSRVMAWANVTGNDAPHIAVIRALAHADTPTRPTGVCLLKHVHAYDTDGGNGVSDCTLRIRPVASFESTRYEIYRTPLFGTEDVSPLLTVGGAAYGRYDTDTTFKVGSTPAFYILSDWWKAVIPTGQELTVIVLGDHRPAGYTIAAAERHEMTHHEGLFDPDTTRDRTSPEEAHWRSCYWATYQQLTDDSFTATYDSATRRFLPVGDVGDFRDDDTITVFDADNVRYYTIYDRIDHTDSDPDRKDTLVLTGNDGVAWGPQAVVLSGHLLGVRVGDDDLVVLASRERRFLASDAGIGVHYVDLEEPLETTSGTIRLVSPTGAFEFRTYAPVGGDPATRVRFSGSQVTENAYPVGSFVVVEEDASWCPLFYRLRPEEGAVQAEQLAQTRAVRIGIK